MKLLFLLTLLFGSIVYGSHGLSPISKEERSILKSHIRNSLEEFPTSIGITRVLESKFDLSLSEEGLPLKVDNSRLPSFPPIGDQGILGSCVAFAATYYQASHEIGLVHGFNNKTDFTHVLSPKWTYNLINQGSNMGASVLAAYQLLESSGAVSILEFPYDQDYTAWDLETDHWIAALSNRMSSYTLIPGLGSTAPQDLTAIKAALNNGHVLTLGSFIDSWCYTVIKEDPEQINNFHVGEYAAYYMKGEKGGHLMTVVGYDDTLWIDVNQNGHVDEGERGAFLIANSWGTGWGNHGFMWISYDAFREISAVNGSHFIHRVPAGAFFDSCLVAITPKKAYYSPKLIAQFSITQSVRNEMMIQTGISSIYEERPSSWIPIPAFANRGGAFEFDGKSPSTPQTVTFAIDLTDLIPESGDLSRYYLQISDNSPGNPTILQSFSIIDLEKGIELHNNTTPKIYDNTSGEVYLEYNRHY